MIIAIFAWWAVNSWAEVKFSTLVDKALITTRDELRFTLRVEAPKPVSFQFPEVSAQLDGMRIVDFGEKESTETGRFQKEKYFVLRADLAGSYILPALSLKVDNVELKSGEIFVEVESALKKEEQEGKDVSDIRGLKDLSRGKSYRLYSLLAILLATGLVAMGVFWWRRYQQRRPAVALAVLPHEYAAGQLALLSQNLPVDLASMKVFAYQLSEIFRWYVEQIYHFPATDLTTEEIRGRYRQQLGCTSELQEDFLQLLVKLDVVKFTDTSITGEDCGQFLSMVQNFIRATAPANATSETQKTQKLEDGGEDFL